MQEPPKVQQLKTVSISRCAVCIDEISQREVDDLVAIEEPLEIFLFHQHFATTMRTPGNDGELVTGLLYSEGLIEGLNDIQQLQFQPHRIDVTLRRELAPLNPPSLGSQRALITTSSCGACGSKSLSRLPKKQLSGAHPKLSVRVLFEIAPRLTSQQSLYELSGGTHGAGLFDFQGELLLLYEDVGRHNAVDKIVGGFLRSYQQMGYKTSQTVLALSGRVSFDLIQKACQAEIPWVVALGAPSSLAIETARELNVGLAGFLKGTCLNIYHNPEGANEP